MSDITKVILINGQQTLEGFLTPGVAPPAGTPALVVWDMAGGGGGGGGDGAILDGFDPLIRATVFDRPNSNPVAVQLVDINGDPLAGSAVSIADGADVAEGTTTDPAWDDVAAGATVIALLKALGLKVPGTASVTGALAALNDTLVLALDGHAMAQFLIPAGTFNGTVSVESSIDGGVTFTSTIAAIMNQSLTAPFWSADVGVAFLPGSILIPVAGATHVRLIVTSYSGGTTTATGRAIGEANNYVVSPPRNKLQADWVRITGSIGTGACEVTTSPMAGNDGGLNVRNIPVTEFRQQSGSIAALNGVVQLSVLPSAPGPDQSDRNIKAIAVYLVIPAAFNGELGFDISFNSGLTWFETIGLGLTTYIQSGPTQRVTAAKIGTDGIWAINVPSGVTDVRVKAYTYVSGLVSAVLNGSHLIGVELNPSVAANTPIAQTTIKAASLPLPTGAATEVTLATRASEATLATRASEATLATMLTLAGFQARINTLGQKIMATSTPVVLPSDQSAIPITAAALPLPAGAATEATQLLQATAANQTTEIARLTSILAQLDVALSTRNAEVTQLAIAAFLAAAFNTLGQKTMALSAPVVIASDQSPIAITGAISANSSADVLLADDDAGYVDGETGKNLTQTPDGRLRAIMAAKVSDFRESYIDGELRSLSMTSDGRLRVATSPALSEFDFFNASGGIPPSSPFDLSESPWSALHE